MLLISAIVAGVSYVYLDDVYQQRQLANRDMQKWKSKINSSVENNQIIEEFESNFLTLVHQGVVGTEDRLSWFETIQNTAKRRGMPSVKYSISSQKKLDTKKLKAKYRGIDVFKSVMKLDIKMAHEGDMFALLNDLKKADGLYAVDRCDIQKTSDSVGLNNSMTAVCQLGWYTFKREASKKRPKRPG
jgi:hypothetical protein